MTTRRQSKGARAGKRELLTAGTDKRLARRDASGQFREGSGAAVSFHSATGRAKGIIRGAARRAASSENGGRSSGKRKPPGIGADYLALVRRFPLRPIRGAKDYDAAAEVLDGLVTKAENELTAGERDYLDTLTLLVERYDEEHCRMNVAGNAPGETLKYLMEQSGMGVADLGRVIGSQPAASMVVNGRRELSKAHIRKLADHFKVEPGLLL